MADQMSRIKSKRQVLQSKPLRLCLQTMMMGLWVLAASICSVFAATCPSLVAYSAATTTEQYSFSGYSSIQTYGVAVGSVSNSLYYLHYLYPSKYVAVRKVDASDSQTWMASFALWSIAKSLSVDAAEQNVYLTRVDNPLLVLRLAASAGSIITQHQL